MTMNKLKLLVVFTMVMNISIFVFVDSTYCKPAWWLIILGLTVQGVCAFLLLQGSLLPKKETSYLELSREGAIILLLGCLSLVYNGSLGTNEKGRTSDCPNTWIQYMYE